MATATTYKIRITAAKLNVRSGASTSYKIVGLVKSPSQFTASKKSNGWYYISAEKGWVSGKYVKVLSTTKPTTTKKTDPNKTTVKDPPKTPKTSSFEQDLLLDGETIRSIMKRMDAQQDKFSISTRLFGLPYQFTEFGDMRIDAKKELGRKFTETIIAEGPIVSIAAGRPLFLPDLGDAEKKGFFDFLDSQSKDTPGGKEVLNSILGDKRQRFFDYVSDHTGYIQYVNILCRTAAVYMGLGQTAVDWAPTKGGKPQVYSMYNWDHYRFETVTARNPAKGGDLKTPKQIGAWEWFSTLDYKKALADEWDDITKTISQSIYESLFGDFQYVKFYVDPNSSISESSSNATQSSMIEGVIDKFQDLSKELMFFTSAADAEILSSMQASIGNTATAWSKSSAGMAGGLVERFLATTGAVAVGANMIFPEIWTDAQYNKSYSLTINLVSPYGDKESIYLNVIVPLMHILAFSMPRQSSPNSYMSPFLTRVSAKGWFSCEMGMVESLTVEKDGWTVDGLPSEVKVQLTIKDLYSNMMIAPASRPAFFLNNPSLMNYLAVTCGMDLTQTNWWLKLQSIGSLLFNIPFDIADTFFGNIKEGVRNFVQRTAGSLF